MIFILGASGVAALCALNSFRIDREIRRVADDIQNKSESHGLSGNLVSNRGSEHLDSLIESINVLLARAESEGHQALELNSSNRILARDMKRLFQLVDSITDGLILIGGASKIILANKASAPFLE